MALKKKMDIQVSAILHRGEKRKGKESDAELERRHSTPKTLFSCLAQRTRTHVCFSLFGG